MFRKLLMTVLVLCTTAVMAFAQTGTLTGTVTSSQTGELLTGVNIFIVELERGAASNIDGNYTIENITPGEYNIRVSYVGFSTINETVTVTSGENTLNFEMTPDVGLLDEIVVSGVSGETERKKLTVSVSKVDAAQLSRVPATSVSGSLAGKVSGVTIRSGSGQPGGASQIQLRADNNLNTGFQPMIIVDGVILEGSMADINADDIQSIEVVKGAAAASLYGSRAGNGVVVIQTKRGNNLADGEIDVTVRNEMGIQQLENYVDLSMSHPFELAEDWQQYEGQYTKYAGVTGYPDGYQGGYHPDITGSRSDDEDHYMDNPFAITKDPQKEFFQNGTNMTNYVSLATRVDNINIFTSYEHSTQEGIIPNTDGYDRNNFRVNADWDITDRIKFSASNLVIRSTSNSPGGGGGIFFNIVLAEPDNNFHLENPDGQPYFLRHNHWSNEENPLYQTYKNDRDEFTQRFLGNYNLRVNITDWLEYKGTYSMENNNNRYTSYYPFDYYIVGGSGEYGIQYSEGSLYKYSSEENSQTTQHNVTARQQFGKLFSRVTFSYLWEDSHFESFDASGSDFKIRELPRFQAIDPSDISASSYLQDVRAQNYFAIASFDWDDKYILDGMFRRDGSSLFGPESRWNNYYRISGAYRITQDIEIPGLDELKIRAAQGTAGIRPGFSWQYETFSVSGGNASKSSLGNRNLKPSQTKETEFAINGTVSSIVDFEFIYSNSETTDQFLNVPLLPLAGFSSQWRNAGSIDSESFEVNIQSSVINERDMSWDVGITWSKSNQTIGELGVPPYQSGPGGLFYIREGEEYGAIYGFDWVKSLDVMAEQLADGETIDDYEINSDGYVIPAGTEGTVDETPIKLKDEFGDDAFVQIGSGRPDWTAGVSNTFRYKGFSAYVLLDIKQGGDVYNRKSQWLTRDSRNGIMDQAGKPEDQKKAYDYYQAFYDVNTNNAYWVEDAGYVKLREVSLSYDFSQEQLATLTGGALKGATISAIGRNLLTFTDYSGYDPEVGSIRTPYDGTGTYPNFRNMALSLSLKF
ncbi:SusC/RagA family TonB-linked outer membrane protein [Gracilimonas sp.]|uniref:SusC/RagA family TonB-linked outer membrane protein n=1 Tax=Gracilimonas sp. TaxID=1974203 RepID=UPI00287253BD|nr:SusC/RagA family TonB-linked outer membrane protein [Gracilimonas sp.]